MPLFIVTIPAVQVVVEAANSNEAFFETVQSLDEITDEFVLNNASEFRTFPINALTDAPQAWHGKIPFGADDERSVRQRFENEGDAK